MLLKVLILLAQVSWLIRDHPKPLRPMAASPGSASLSLSLRNLRHQLRLSPLQDRPVRPLTMRFCGASAYTSQYFGNTLKSHGSHQLLMFLPYILKPWPLQQNSY